MIKYCIGDKVRVVAVVDYVGEYLRPYIGRIGVVRKTGDGTSIENMISVQFGHKQHDAFWPEELELL